MKLKVGKKREFKKLKVDECFPHVAFIASLQDNRWPASHSLREQTSRTRRVTGRSRWPRKEGGWREGKRNKGSYRSRKRHITWNLTERKLVMQRERGWDEDKKDMWRERIGGGKREYRKRAPLSSICSYSMDVLFVWFRETIARYSPHLKQMFACISPTVARWDLNKGGPYVTHMPPSESFNMQRVTVTSHIPDYGPIFFMCCRGSS